MENSDQQTTLNPQSNISNNNQFAKKQPLIDPSVLKTSKKIAILAIGVVILVILFQIIFNFIRNKTYLPQINTNTPEEIVETPTPSTKKFFSYLKDEKAIWISDTTGNNKEMILEIPTASKSFFSTITWKKPKEITYVICEEDIGPCEVNTINIQDKAITNEYNSEGLVKKLNWNKTGSYLAFIEEFQDTNREYARSFKIKTGTIINMLSVFLVDIDLNNIRYNVQFGSDDKYIVFSDTKKEVIKKNNNSSITIYTPFVEVFLLNGTKVDYVAQTTDPFFITESKLGYIKDRSIIYKEIGEKDETIATIFNGHTPAISPDKTQIAYWYTEGNLNNVVLGVFDTNLNIHRNILRGIVLPKWISESEILGIKADNCLQGLNCELYQFQTNSISIVDIRRGNVIQVDQGKRISEPSFIFFDEAQYAN